MSSTISTPTVKTTTTYSSIIGIGSIELVTKGYQEHIKHLPPFLHCQNQSSVCVCVCVCVRERERERERREREREEI